MRVARKIPPKTAPRMGPRCAEGKLKVGPELELEAVEVGEDPTDTDEDGMVAFVRYI